ncbi:hypothetical protein QNH98_09175 [Myroides sp. mNGS23_01]|nr:hypothetical protein [Myroides sp. mNGS23_01]WHT40681.1 hypothetical protein QNH98_09175 [Myroides sp. mNGS23_01]
MSAKDEETLYQLVQPNQVVTVAKANQPLVNFNENEQGQLLVITATQVLTLQGGNQLIETIQHGNLVDAVEVNGVYYFASSSGGLFQLAKGGKKNLYRLMDRNLIVYFHFWQQERVRGSLVADMIKIRTTHMCLV